jgi:predicted nucleotidyltransferase component of viral defense system
MIKPGEIQQKANAVGVRDQQIEKDYILSWILFGISKHEELSKTIVFKGGTESGWEFQQFVNIL